MYTACRSPYAQIVGIGTNNDGFTDKGITFPSGEAQRELGTSVRRPAQMCSSPNAVMMIDGVRAHGK